MPSKINERERCNVNHTQAIKKVMKDTKTRQIDLAERIGAKSHTVISERVNYPNISLRTMLEMLDAMGYELLVRQSRDEQRDGEYPIRLSDYQDQ